MSSELFFTGFLGKRVHLGITGSIAAYKALDILRDLTRLGISVSATVTDSAAKFVSPLSFEALGADPVYSAMFAPGDDIYAHLMPGRSCDCLAVVPATANTMAKMACGLADTMLSCQALSFPGPIVVAPAMNPNLWEAPATKANLDTLLQRGVDVVFPDSGDVACGDTGKGRLAASFDIVARILKAISPKDLAGQRVLVTLGPTREPFDAVRFWSNPSSGLMGSCLAFSAWLRGAEVTAVCGPTQFTLPEGINRIDVQTAAEMFDAVMDLWPAQDIGCATAAVADFSPVKQTDGKFKKQSSTDEVFFAFTRSKDILKTMGEAKGTQQRLIGFAAEAEDLEANAKDKLTRKHLDMIICNPVNKDGAGFVSSTNEVLVLDAHGRSEAWPNLPNNEVAWRIRDQLLMISR